MATESIPTLYQAITASYRIRNILHAARQGKLQPTLCGRVVEKRSNEIFDPTVGGVCGKCVQSVKVMERAHPGFE